MDEVFLKDSIKTLNEMLHSEFNIDNDQVFDELKGRLSEESSVLVQNKIHSLSYVYNWSEEEFIFDAIPPDSKDEANIKILIKLYQEKLFEFLSPEKEEDLYKKKILKAKNNNIDFFEELGCMVVGDTEFFPYRSSFYITKFFQESGYPNLKHDGSTRKTWAANVLEDMSLDDIYNIIKCIFKKKYFIDAAKIKNGKEIDIDKAKNTLKELLSFSCQEDEFEDLKDVFDININSSLLFNQKITTKDTTLNDDLENARQCYLKGNLQLAIEKIWDVFERIKSLYNLDKKKSISCIVNVLSDEIKQADNASDCEEKELLFNNELIILTKIGNTYKIRHSEQKQKSLSNNQTKEYLFFRVLNIINLIYFRMQG